MTEPDRLRELADEFGTPLYLYDLDRLDDARRDLFGWLPEEFEVFYALKANPHVDLVRALRGGEGRTCRAEISSTGELAAALEAGHDPARILYTGPGKTPGELREAIGLGVRLFSAESLGDLEHIGAAALAQDAVAECLLRINDATAQAATGVRMTGRPTQFGIDSETLADLAPRLRSVPGTSLAGLHLFSQSNATDEDALIAEFRHTIDVAARIEAELGVPLRLLDIGGGFASPYGQHGRRTAYPNLRAALEAALDTRFPQWRQGTPRLAVESGRYLVGDCGTLLASVTNVKTGRGRTFVVLDAGINTFGGLSGLGRILPVSVRPGPGGAAETRRVTLAGPLCTPGDTLGRDVEVPADLGPGDRVAIPNTGAYGPTASLLMFLGRPAPAEVVVRDGDVVSVSRIEHVRTYRKVAGEHD
ncbi:type III PLP-dependent enzyme [Streptomyces sp. NPDC018610]|uniref:type III PLP-dependent enzyme n=1 Tax=Streptomyces sp. NPDC018610 TaxID=3365049 RepID=UPI0037B2F25F